MIDFACVSSTTPTWSNDPRWCTPGTAATEAEHGTQFAIPAGTPAPEGGDEQGAQELLPAELDALDTELEYVDFAYFGQVPPSGLDPPPRDGDEPRLWILTDDTAARGLAEQRGLTAYDNHLFALGDTQAKPVVLVLASNGSELTFFGKSCLLG
eukprot:jgi/Tetstr1/428261/TSEL_018300.t1